MTRRRPWRAAAILLASLTCGLCVPPALEATDRDGGASQEVRQKRRKPHKPHKKRRCKPGRSCRGGTGVCNDDGRCCNARDGDVACGSECCESGIQGCCDGAACTDLLSDPSNCGSCGKVCAMGAACENGDCACPEGTSDCSGTCTNLWTDDANCGSCGGRCWGGSACDLGTCACPGGEFDRMCDEVCTNVLWDAWNCGGCGNACGDGMTCFAGACRCANVGEISCNGRCIDGFSDRNNCGACGNVCPAGTACEQGRCATPCGRCEERVAGVCIPKDCGPGKACDPLGNCRACLAHETQCGNQCILGQEEGAECCAWNQTYHLCSAGEQCAREGCCSGDAVVCTGTPGTPTMCCYGGLQCVQRAGTGEAVCCMPQGLPAWQCRGDHALPAVCCFGM